MLLLYWLFYCCFRFNSNSELNFKSLPSAKKTWHGGTTHDTLASLSLSQNSHDLHILSALHSLHLLSYHRSEEVSAHRVQPSFSESAALKNIFSHESHAELCRETAAPHCSFHHHKPHIYKSKASQSCKDQCQAKCVAFHIHSCQPANPAAAVWAMIDS